MRLRSGKLARDELVTLTVNVTPLGMPDDRHRAANVAQHRCRDLARVGALRLRADILRAEHYCRFAQQARDIGEIHKRRTNRAVDAVESVARDDRLNEARVLRARPVHLPVSGYERSAAHKRRAIIAAHPPGRNDGLTRPRSRVPGI